MIVATGATDVAAQQPEEKKASYDQIMETVASIEALQLETARLREQRMAIEASDKFKFEHGYTEEVKKHVRVNFASHFPSGEAITQSVYEYAASVAKKPSAPQVVILVVRARGEEALTLRTGNRFSNTEYEQKIVDMARNVSNSFEDPQAKVLLTLAVEQEDKINTSPGDILFYINGRVDHFSPTGEDYKDLDEDQFIREVAFTLGHQFSTGHYKLSQSELLEALGIDDEGRMSRNDNMGSRSSSGDTGGTGDGDKSVSTPVLADNSM